MPRTYDWNTVEQWQRVIASAYATGVKLDLKKMAKILGVTFDTLEGRMRKIKKEAETLKQEADGRGDEDIQPTRTKSNPTTPRKAKTPTPKKDVLGSVANGRVTKKPSAKKNTTTKIEDDAEGEDDDFGLTKYTDNFSSTTFDYGSYGADYEL